MKDEMGDIMENKVEQNRVNMSISKIHESSVDKIGVNVSKDSFELEEASVTMVNDKESDGSNNKTRWN